MYNNNVYSNNRRFLLKHKKKSSPETQNLLTISQHLTNIQHTLTNMSMTISLQMQTLTKIQHWLIVNKLSFDYYSNFASLLTLYWLSMDSLWTLIDSCWLLLTLRHSLSNTLIRRYEAIRIAGEAIRRYERCCLFFGWWSFSPRTAVTSFTMLTAAVNIVKAITAVRGEKDHQTLALLKKKKKYRLNR